MSSLPCAPTAPLPLRNRVRNGLERGNSGFPRLSGPLKTGRRWKATSSPKIGLGASVPAEAARRRVDDNRRRRRLSAQLETCPSGNLAASPVSSKEAMYPLGIFVKPRRDFIS